MDINCERYSAKIDAATCLARQQAAGAPGAGCKGCEEGARVMAEHEAGKFQVSTYPSGAPKIIGICAICGEKKTIISKKNPTCEHCRKIKAGKIPANTKGPGKKTVPSAPSGSCIFSVDLGNCPEAVEKLRQRAAEQFRTVEAQIAWELKENILT